MKEVSCRALSVIVHAAEEASLPLEDLLAGMSVTAVQLRDPHHRIDWDEMCVILERFEERLGPGILDSASFTRSPVMTKLGSIFGLFGSARAIYWASHRWFNQSLFTVVSSELEELGDGRIRLTLTLPPEIRDSPQFFEVCRVTLRAIPTLLGQPPALVEASIDRRRADFTIKVPSGFTVGGWLRRRWRVLWSARGVVEELATQQALLQTRYRELVEATREREAQSARLQMVNLLAQEMTKHTSLPRLGEVIGQLLNERLHSRAARVWAARESAQLELVREVGTAPESPPQQWPLVHGGRVVGRIDLWGIEATASELGPLLNDLLPWIAVAVANATTFAMQQDYQAQLTRMVDERTAALRKTTEKLEEALDRQKALDQQRADFFANASHELRTPLTLILSPLERLASSPSMTVEVREELQRIVQSLYRMTKLVNDLLDMSAMEAGKLKLRVGLTDLTGVFRAVLGPWRDIIERRHIHLTVSLPESLPLVADAERLEQVALNLISNAVKYSPDGGWLKIWAEQQGKRAQFVVENGGPGIPAEDVPRIFDRFAQAAHSTGRRFGSTGLGLPLVREIVELHHGRVEVTNRPGERVAFAVSLPIGEVEAYSGQPPTPQPTLNEFRQYEAVAAVAEEDWAPPRPRGERPVVVVAEDNVELRRFIGRALVEEFDVVLAADGREALELINLQAPDAVLTDLMMPNMDGLELCRALKSETRTHAIPVIVLTARGELESKLEGLREGADDYLLKPFSTQELLLRLKGQLRMRHLADRLAQREKLAALGTMVAGVAHEVRNPLNGILNALGPVRQMLQPGSEALALVDLALEGARRVERISSQLLRQARAGEGQRTQVSLNENVQLAIDLISHKAAAGPRIIADLQEEEVAVFGEPAALHQVWINLLDNAIDAAGPDGEVRVSVARRDRQAFVEVGDSGPGMSPQVLRRVFDPFFTTKDVGRGTGLGLHVVREIVAQHGGSIEAHSSAGQGARFLVSLPSV